MLSTTDRLALMRTELANERTLLAYARTALALAAGGVGLAQLARGPALAAVGWVLVVGATAVAALGLARFRRTRDSLARLQRSVGTALTEGAR